MLHIGEGVLVVLTAGLLLQDLPAVGSGLELQIILRSGGVGRIVLLGSIGVLRIDAGGLTVGVFAVLGLLRLIHDQGLVGVSKGSLAVLSRGNGGQQLVLEIAAQEHVGGDGLNQIAADIGIVRPVQGDAAVLSQGIDHAVGGEFLSTGGVGGQGLIVELEGQLLVRGIRVDHVLGGITHHNAVAGNGEHFIADLVHGIVMIGEIEGILALLDGQHGLGLCGEPKQLIAVAAVAELGVFLGLTEALADGFVGIEELILSIGRNQAADKGKDEHENQDDQAGNSHTVADKALGHQHTGRKNLNAAVVVQRIMLLRRRLVGILHFLANLLAELLLSLLLSLLLIDVIFAICHFLSSSLLKRCVPAGRPRRTEYQKSGCPTGSARP